MKSLHDKVFDNGLDYVKTNCNKLVVCKAPPTTFDEANNLDTGGPAGYKVAEVAMASGDFTIQDKTGGGREIVAAAKPGISPLDDSLTTDDHHFAYLNTTLSELLWVTDETTDPEILLTDTVSFPSLKVGLPDPV